MERDICERERIIAGQYAMRYRVPLSVSRCKRSLEPCARRTRTLAD
jgi:hypothetical protein